MEMLEDVRRVGASLAPLADHNAQSRGGAKGHSRHRRRVQEDGDPALMTMRAPSIDTFPEAYPRSASADGNRRASF